MQELDDKYARAINALEESLGLWQTRRERHEPMVKLHSAITLASLIFVFCFTVAFPPAVAFIPLAIFAYTSLATIFHFIHWAEACAVTKERRHSIARMQKRVI